MFFISFISFSFADSTLDQAISWMYSKGLTKFDNSQDFMANKSLRRDEATKFFVQYAKEIQNSISDETKMECDKFTDLAKWWTDLADTMKGSCKLGLFQWTNWKFMPTQALTNAQAITVLIRMIDGKKDETQWHFAQKYFERAKELGIMNWLNLNSTANFDKLATRGEIAILLFNASNLSGIRLNNQDFSYIESEVKTVSQKYKLDSKERQDYINSLYGKEAKEWSKEDEIIWKTIRALEERTNTIYVKGFKCSILAIESIFWESWTSNKNNQIVEINLSCKNLNKDSTKADFSYVIKDVNSKDFYSNDIGLKSVVWYKDSNFFTNIDIKPAFDSTKTVNPLWIISWRMLAEIPQKVIKIKFWMAYKEEIAFKVTSLSPTMLLSKDGQIKQLESEAHKECLALFSETECFAIENTYVSEWLSQYVFDVINNILISSWKEYYSLSISDSYFWKNYCKETDYSMECVWIRDGKVVSKTKLYY